MTNDTKPEGKVEGDGKLATPEEAKKVGEPKAPEKTEAELAMEKRQEDIVIFCREKLMPLLKEKNKNIEKSKVLVETILVALQQGVQEMLSKHTVKDLSLKQLLIDTKKKNPEAEVDDFIDLVELVEDKTMRDVIETLQWFGQKMDAEIKNVTKDKTFNEIVKDF